MKRCHGTMVVAALVWAAALLASDLHPCCIAEEKPRDLGDRLELFVDRQMIESLHDARLVLHPPRREEVALEFDAPWEGPHSTYVTVFQDGDKFRMYYRGWTSPEKANRHLDDSQVACYAESTDGIHWTKPELGLFEVNGSKANNVVWKSKTNPAHNFTPFKDTRPGVPDDERYKAVMDGRTPERKHALYALASADGIHWRELGPEPILTIEGFGLDSQNLVFWDTQRGKYVAYFRIFAGDSRESRIRTVATATSDDFRHWTSAMPVDFGDTPLEHFYTNATVPYFRAPHYYFMFPKRYNPDRRLLTEHPREGISEGVFLSSRDGEHFDRTFREALIRPGRDPKNWGDRSSRTSWGMLQTAPDEMSIYYSQHYRFSSNHLRRGVWRLDGIASVQAGYEPGEVVTKPFTFSGKELVLNYATSAAGSVQVEIQDPAGKPIEGYTLADGKVLFGDEIAGPYSWKSGSDVSKLAGKPVRLRFVLKDADLYSYRFSE